MKDDLIRELNDRFAESTVVEVLQYFLNEYKGRIAFASSLGAEDQVLTHMIREIAPDTKIFTLDTGRMFQETYDLIDRTNARYKMKMEIYFPDYKQVENMVNENVIRYFSQSRSIIIASWILISNSHNVISRHFKSNISLCRIIFKKMT